jgi:hypothetical protein
MNNKNGSFNVADIGENVSLSREKTNVIRMNS